MPLTTPNAAAMVEAALDGVIAMDHEGRVTEFNPAAESMFGRTRSESMGQPLAELIIPPALREAHRAGLKRYLATGEGPVLGKRIEIVAIRADGTEFPVELSITRLQSRGTPTFIGFIRDLSERRNAESALREREARDRQAAERAEARSRSLLLAAQTFAQASVRPVASLLDTIVQHLAETIGDACAIRLLSEDGKYLELAALHHTDPPALAFLQEVFAERREELGEAPSSRVILTGEPLLIPVLSHAYAASLPPSVARYIERFGACSLLAVPLRSSASIIGNLTMWRGLPGRPYTVADQSVLQELGERAAVAIEHARLHQGLRMAIQQRDDFLSIAGHELKTPLTGLLLQIQGIQRAMRMDPTAEIGHRLDKALGSGVRMERLITQLLDASRLVAGKLQLEPERFDLGDLLREVVARFADTSAIAMSLRCETPVNGNWDRARIDQVITNLLSNAVKYGQSKPIDVELCVDGHDAVLRVVDHGIGIDEEHQKKIFQRFERAVAAREFGGVGLGLWITRQIVEASAGTIEVQSAPGQGSTFTVRLPIDLQQQPGEERHAIA